MNGYILEGPPFIASPILDQLKKISGILIHNVTEHNNTMPGMANQVSRLSVVFFAMDEETANFLKLKYPPDVFRNIDT